MERCILCGFWNGERCTQTFRLTIHITPVGGQVDFQTTPGMVPEEMKAEIGGYFHKFIDKLIPVIEMMPIWDRIREFQAAIPERKDCPARRERDDIKPYLRIVKT